MISARTEEKNDPCKRWLFHDRPVEAPLVERIHPGEVSPIELFQRSGWKHFAFLLEGSMGGWFDGRFSILGGSPFGILQSKKDKVQFDCLVSGMEHSFFSTGDPIVNLQSWLDRFQPPSIPKEVFPDIPFLYGGVVGYFSYDLVRRFEKIPPPLQDDLHLPDITLLFLNHFIVLDQVKRDLYIIYNPLPEIKMGKNAQSAYREGNEKIGSIQKKLENRLSTEEPSFSSSSPPVEAELSREEYLWMVRRAKEYIAAGDIFQANLSQRFSIPFHFHPSSMFKIYQRLRQINPSPFSAYVDLGEIQIASASPERLVRVKRGIEHSTIETRPIAGTRPRGRDDIEDKKMIKALYESEKERAEHLMLVDLERNDLGKICRYGSVSVDSLMALEKYSHVLHLVSQIRGELKPGTPPLQVLKALFPGGTITGVPKIRCMQIISELEKRSRGIYTGAIGYIGFTGEMDLNIAIRTWVRRKDEMTFQVGAGIVADSDPEAEYQETLQKAAALVKALQEPPSP